METADLAAQLFTASSSAARAKLLASVFVDLIPDSACVIYRFEAKETGAGWKMIAHAGDVAVTSTELPTENSLLSPMLNAAEPISYGAAQLHREDYGHLQVNRSVASITYLPLVWEEQLAGAVEIIAFSAELSLEHLEAIAPVVQVGTSALMSAQVHVARPVMLFEDLQSVGGRPFQRNPLAPQCTARKCSQSNGMSPARSRSGGN